MWLASVVEPCWMHHLLASVFQFFYDSDVKWYHFCLLLLYIFICRQYNQDLHIHLILVFPCQPSLQEHHPEYYNNKHFIFTRHSSGFTDLVEFNRFILILLIPCGLEKVPNIDYAFHLLQTSTVLATKIQLLIMTCTMKKLPVHVPKLIILLRNNHPIPPFNQILHYARYTQVQLLPQNACSMAII